MVYSTTLHSGMVVDLGGLVTKLLYSTVTPFSTRSIRLLFCEAPQQPTHQEQKIISHHFVQSLLSNAGITTPIDVGRTIYGKPQARFSNTLINFNISHSENITVGLTDRMPVGIDIEAKDRLVELDTDYLYSEVFMTKFDALNALRTHTLIELWTIKEAVLKASGYGLWGGLKNVSINMINHNQGVASFCNQHFEVEIAQTGRFILALAFLKKINNCV